MTAAAIDLCTVVDVQQYLGATVAGDAARIQQLITAVSTNVQSMIGYNVAAQAYEETFNGHGGSRRTVSVRPVLGVSRVVVDGSDIRACTSATDSGFIADAYGAQMRGYSFCTGTANVLIAYTAGYEAIPLDLNQLVVEVVTSKLKRTARIGLVSLAMAKETTMYTREDYTEEHKAIMNRYQLPAIS